MVHRKTAAMLLALASVAPAAAAQRLDASAWSIDFSRGMPARPLPASGGWAIDFPFPGPREGHVNYVSFAPGPLTAARAILVDLRIEAAPGTRFVARDTPAMPATVSLFLQRRGDSLSRRHALYRWYAPRHGVIELAPGLHRLVVPIDHGWTSVLGEPAAAHAAAFRDALADAGRIGLVFGSTSRRGHGVHSTGPARLTVTDFRIL